jgi:hypothetical protein
MPNTPCVTIGVPVYNGGLYIEETLRSIQAQTHQNIEVIISFDGPQPLSEQLCRPFIEDPRFHIIVQPERLGWVDHINWLMARVETPYWYCHPQDDLVDPRYVEILLEHAVQMPEAAVVYCDLAGFGLQSPKIIQSSVTGRAFARQFALLYEHYPAVAFRGLTRVEALHHAGPIRANPVESFATDTTWMAAMARWGELQRVPFELYRKRYHSQNEHSKWSDWPIEKRIESWMIHCADMLEQAMLVEATIQERRLLWLVCMKRLLLSQFENLPSSRFKAEERLSLFDMFIEHIKTTGRVNVPGLLDENWPDLKQWTQAFYRSPADAEEGVSF